MPQIALMSALTIYSLQAINFKRNIKKIAVGSFCVVLITSLIIISINPWIIENVFHIDDLETARLTHTYINMLLFLLPLHVITTIQRGIFYAYGDIKYLTLLDIFNYVIFIIPIFTIGQFPENVF